MRNIKASDISEAIAGLCARACCELSQDIRKAIRDAILQEESPIGREILEQLEVNADIAKNESIPICQDTGIVVVLVELGQDAHIYGGSLSQAINDGIAKGYREGYLRKSVVSHPLDRSNTGDNTPAVIHYELVPGDKLKIALLPKGAGSENMSTVRMLNPSAGIDGVKKAVLDTVRSAGANACPPLIVGIGLGGTMEKAALLAKKALLRRIDEPNPNPSNAHLEQELLELLNRTGIGPAGLGGRVTALAVHVESYPCHIASLPLAVNLQCHAARHLEIEL